MTSNYLINMLSSLSGVSKDEVRWMYNRTGELMKEHNYQNKEVVVEQVKREALDKPWLKK